MNHCCCARVQISNFTSIFLWALQTSCRLQVRIKLNVPSRKSRRNNVYNCCICRRLSTRPAQAGIIHPNEGPRRRLTHVKLLLRLREALPVERVDEEHNAVHGGEIILPKLSRSLVPSEIERLEPNLVIKNTHATGIDASSVRLISMMDM